MVKASLQEILLLKGKTNAVSFPAKISVKNSVVTLESDKFTIDRQNGT